MVILETHVSNQILLISGSGLLGSTLNKMLPPAGFHVSATSRKSGTLTLDLENAIAPQLFSELKNRNYSCGILCAAVTDVEECFRNPKKARRANVAAIEEALSLFKEFQIKPVFFSSDLVFNNHQSLYREEDAPSPTTLYGRQKLEIEQKIRENFPEHLIFRTSKLMCLDLHPRSILTGLIHSFREGQEVKAFNDQYISPVFAEDVAAAVAEAIKSKLNGTYHLACNEVFSRYELACLVAKVLGISTDWVGSISMKDFSFSEPRGPNNTLCSEKIARDLGIKFWSVEDGVRKILKEAKTRLI